MTSRHKNTRYNFSHTPSYVPNYSKNRDIQEVGFISQLAEPKDILLHLKIEALSTKEREVIVHIIKDAVIQKAFPRWPQELQRVNNTMRTGMSQKAFDRFVLEVKRAVRFAASSAEQQQEMLSSDHHLNALIPYTPPEAPVPMEPAEEKAVTEVRIPIYNNPLLPDYLQGEHFGTFGQEPVPTKPHFEQWSCKGILEGRQHIFVANRFGNLPDTVDQLYAFSVIRSLGTFEGSKVYVVDILGRAE